MVNSVNVSKAMDIKASQSKVENTSNTGDNKFKTLMDKAAEKTSSNNNKVDTKKTDTKKTDSKTATDKETVKSSQEKVENTNSESNKKEVMEEPAIIDVSMIAMLLSGAVVTEEDTNSTVPVQNGLEQITAVIGQEQTNGNEKSAVNLQLTSNENQDSVQQVGADNLNVGKSTEEAATQQNLQKDIELLKDILTDRVSDAAQTKNNKTQEQTAENGQNNKVHNNAEKASLKQSNKIEAPKTEKSSQTEKQNEMPSTDEVIPNFQNKASEVQDSSDVVKVKVGDGQTIDGQDMAAKLAEKILIKAAQNKNEFEVQLAPENLGKILVKVAFKDGETVVSMICSNPKTLSLLAENARGISDIVESNTGNHATINVQQDKDDFYDQQRQHSDNKGQENQQHHNHQNKDDKDTMSLNFIQQMRLGLVETGGWEKSYRL